MSAGAFGSLLLDTAQHYTDKTLDYYNKKNFFRQDQRNYVKNHPLLSFWVNESILYRA